MKISVIVPVYNVENYLGRCLDSLLDQTYQNLEIICVNDGSTDHSLSLLAKYKAADSRIKIINKENGGLSSARNAGLAAATGEYCFFVDGDDWILPETLSSMLEKMTSHSVGAVVCHVTNTPAEAVSQQIAQDSQRWFDSYLKKEGVYDVPMNLKEAVASVACNKLYRMDIIRRYDIRFPEGLINEDEAFLWAYMLHISTYYFIPASYYHYVRRANSIMLERNHTAKILDILKIHEIIYQTLDKYRNINEYKDILFQNYTVDANMVFNEMRGPFRVQALELVKKYAFEVNKQDIRLKKYYWGKKYPKLYRFMKYFIYGA